MLTILICGTRNREPRELLEKIISKFQPGDIVIAGAAKGVDRCAAAVARSKGFQVREFPADWDRFGKVAGPLRNQEMLDQRPDVVIAVHDDPSLGKGTKDMVFRASRAGVPVVIFSC